MIALLVKNVVQHGAALVGAVGLLLSTLAIGWVFVFSQELPTLITSATGTLYYCGPVFILYVVERMVAHDRLEGTSEFLAALPLTAFHRLVLPWTFGLVVVAAAFETCLLSTALLASRREGLPLSWLLQIHVQLGLFSFAWYNLAFFVAHLGRYRWLTWWLVFLAFASVDGSWLDNPWRSILWTAPLADPVEQSRSVPPWDSAALVFMWSLLAVLLTVGVDRWRGGTLVARWFAPATARQRASLVVAGMVGLGLSALPETLAPQPDAWSLIAPLPSDRAEVRVAGEVLQPIGRAVAARLDAIGTVAGVTRWPGVVLHPTTRRSNRHVRRAVGRRDVNLVLLVDPDGPTDALVRDIVYEVLIRQTGDLGVDVLGVDALLHGLAGEPSDPVFAERLQLLTTSSSSYREARLAHGRAVAEAVAIHQVAALEDRDAWTQSVLGARRWSGVPSLVRLRWSARGLHEALQHDVTAGGRQVVTTPVLVRDQGGLRAQIAASDRDAVLEIDVLDPLQPDPMPLDATRRLAVKGREVVPLPVDPTVVVAVRLTRYSPALQGWTSSPWVR